MAHHKFEVSVGLMCRATDPASPDQGDVYFNTVSLLKRTFNGTSWDEDGSSSNISGTTSDFFQLDTDNSGPMIKNDGGAVRVRDAGDAFDANLIANNITSTGNIRVEGTLTVLGDPTLIYSNEVNIGDSNLLLNYDNQQNSGNANAGITDRLFRTDAAGAGTISTTGTSVAGTGTAFLSALAVGDVLIHSTDRRNVISVNSNIAADIDEAFPVDLAGQSYSIAKADGRFLEYDVTTGRWQASIGAMGSGVTQRVALVKSLNYGNATDTDYTLTHNLGTTDFAVSVHRISDGENLYPQIIDRTNTQVTIKHGNVVAAAANRAVIIG